MQKRIGIILVNYRDYAERYLPDLKASLEAQTYPRELLSLFVVDNESDEHSRAYLSAQLPDARIIRNEHNDGFAKGNNDGIRKALLSGCELVLLLNFDTVLEADCIERLAAVLESGSRIGAVQARLMLWPDKDRINTLGNATHFLGYGFGVGSGLGLSSADQLLGVKDALGREAIDIFYPSGAGVMFPKEALEVCGLYDEQFWMYNEDQELGWRMRLYGWRNVIAPRAVVYHKYEFNRSIRKFYWMERNRIISMLKCYKLGTLLIILPAFVIMELGNTLYSLQTGWFLEKLKTLKFFFDPKNWRIILAGRQIIQAKRKISDREIARLITGKIEFQEINDLKLKIINPFFNAYWAVARALIFW